MFNLNKKLSIHLIGVGGIGVSGIAQVLIQLGHRVSGSDLNQSSNTEKLEEMGAKVYYSHEASQVEGCDIVVYSSAIKDTNPEIARAKELNLPILRRAEVLADLMKLKKGIAIAGTHGKTTTSSLLTTALRSSEFEPSYVVGGVMSNLNHHAFFDKGDYLVAEVDESDGSFLLFNPIYSLITNVDNDHLNFYGSEENLKNSFLEFANKIPFFGCCFLNNEDPFLSKLALEIKKPVMTFGLSDGCDFQAKDIRYSEKGSLFKVFHQGECLGECQILLPGEHNVLNALGAFSISYFLGATFEQIQKGLKSFQGVARRFQVLENKPKSLIVDDYAHHPTEILKTVVAAKKWMPEKKVKVFFEPHRFSRTKECWAQFLHCFNQADELFLLPIYHASESPVPGIDSDNLARDIKGLHPGLKVEVLEYEEFFSSLKKESDQDSLLLTLGAGSIGRRIREYVK